MIVSAFTFIKNGDILGYPFIESIKSVLPIVDEFVINVGDCEDQTLEKINNISSSKIKIIQSSWNENMVDRGFIYGQQKMIAQYSCSGDWLFYIEGDEIYHEKDLMHIREQLEVNLNEEKVEAIAFKFLHFYGNKNSYLNSPGWYRSEARIIKSSIRSYAPDGLFWLVLDSNKLGRYPRAKLLDIYCYHYGWVRSEEEMNLKSHKIQKYWNKKYTKIDYSQIDQKIIREFKDEHPSVMKQWLKNEIGVFKADKNYKLTKKQRKHRLMILFERIFGIDLSKKHYKKIK